MSKAKRRECPAVQKEISTAECGENRQSRYACPTNCVYNLFSPANYAAMLEVEHAADRNCFERLETDSPNPAQMKKAIQKSMNTASYHAPNAFYVWEFFFKRDADGLTFAERWERAGFIGLKNDERVLLRGKMQMRVALLEIHRILDNEQIEAVDLLSAKPSPLIFRDRKLAAQVVRFDTCLTWIFPTPHFWRLNGSAALIEDMGPFDAKEVVTEIVRHLGGKTTETEMRLWLAEHFARFDDALQATARMRRAQMFAATDTQWGKAIYEMRAPFAQCRDLLDEVAEVDSDPLTQAEKDEGFVESRVWFDHTHALAVPKQAQPMLGTILLGQAFWRLEAMGAERLARLREKFEAKMGTLAKFSGEIRENLSSSLAAHELPRNNEALVPPRLLEEPQKLALTSSRMPPLVPGVSKEETMAQWMREMDRAFLDEAIPALNGRTPREASRDPMLRPKLISLLKQRVRAHDKRNLETGRNDDINWMLRELGADEILFEAPPPRSIPALIQEEANENFTDDEDDLFAPSSLPLATLPNEPFSFEEALARLKQTMEEFDSAAEAISELDANGSDFLDNAWSIVSGEVKPEEFDIMVSFLIQARFSLVPLGFREPKLDFDCLCETFDHEVEKFFKATQSPTPKQIFQQFENGRQPALTMLIVSQFLESMSSMPKKVRPRLEIQPLLGILVKVMIDELDRALRA